MRAAAETTFADTRAADLGLSLEAVELDVLASLRLAIPGGSLELRVLGASHQVVLDVDGAATWETLACGVDGDLPAERATALERRRHRFTSSIRRRVDPAVLAARLLDDLAPDPDALVVAFPGSPDALTAIRAFDLAPGRCAWASWHLYPEAGEVVTTRSQVRW